MLPPSPPKHRSADGPSSADPHGALADLQAALVASGVVGAWSHDIWADRFALSGGLPQLLGIDAARGARGVPLTDVLAGIAGADRERVENVVHAAAAQGGAFEAAFRTQAGARRLALRGRITRDASGRSVQGCGIAIDLTEDEAVGTGGQAQRTVNRMAEHAIALRGLAGDLERPALTHLLDTLMLEIGRELARHLSDVEGGRQH